MLIFLILSNLLFELNIPLNQEKILQDRVNGLISSDYSEAIQHIYSEHVPQLSIAEFKNLDRNNLLVLDTRTEKEFNVSHLKYAREVGYFWFDMRSLYDIPKDTPIVLYCAVGDRSTKVAKKLINSGYKNVHVLYGGIFEWVNRGNPVYNKRNIQTSQVHGYTKKWSKWLKKENRTL